MRRFPYIPTLIVLLAIGLVVMSVVFEYNRTQREEQERERTNIINEQIFLVRELILTSRDDAGEISRADSMISASRENPDREEIVRIVFVHSEEDAEQYVDDPTTITAWPTPVTLYGLENLNELIEGRALNRGETSPRLVTIDDIVYDSDFVLEMINYTGFAHLHRSWARRYHRIEIELRRLRAWGEGGEYNGEIIFDIFEQLDISEDDEWQLLRASSDVDMFITITSLMLEQGLSKEDALTQVVD